jgi:hypothetical protein
MRAWGWKGAALQGKKIEVKSLVTGAAGLASGRLTFDAV